MKKGILICICFLFNHSFAQNLVINGDFENHSSCPIYYGELALADSWSNPNTGTTDYYHVCADSASMVGIPTNWSGYQQAQSGEAYAGISTYYDSPSNIREYLQGELSSSLTPNQCYLFTMYVNVPNHERYSSNSIGVFFSPTSYPVQTNNTLLPVVPQLNNMTTAFPDSSSWMEISGEYQASGGEAFLIIGNFNDSASTQLQINNPTEVLFNGAYLLIDNVSLITCESASLDPSLELGSITTYPNPCSDELSFLGIEEEANLIIFDFSGRRVFESKLDQHQSVNTAFLENGVYSFVLKTNSGKMHQGRFMKK